MQDNYGWNYFFWDSYNYTYMLRDEIFDIKMVWIWYMGYIGCHRVIFHPPYTTYHHNLEIWNFYWRNLMWYYYYYLFFKNILMITRKLLIYAKYNKILFISTQGALVLNYPYHKYRVIERERETEKCCGKFVILLGIRFTVFC